MKSILSVCVIVLVLLNSAWATDYYVSVSGSDSRSATEAKNPATPWKTISKINSYFPNFQPGDRILFKRGETFYGYIKASKSGISGAPITIGAYGSGNKPILTGMVTLGGWVSKGNGIYESYNAALGADVNMVTINGAVQQIGRYPNVTATNKGYLTYEAHGTNSIIDNQLTSSVSWTGAEVVVRSSHWTIDRRKVTSHSGTTVTFNSALTYSSFKNFGYFFQKHSRTLDQYGEWYYNPSTKKVSVFFGASVPSNVKAAAVDYVIYVQNRAHITIQDVQIEGTNEATVRIEGSNNVKIIGCDIRNSGTNAARVHTSSYITFDRCNIVESNNNALDLRTTVSHSTITNCVIEKTGTRAGMGNSGNDTYQAIILNSGTNHLIEYNTIKNTGYNGIRFSGSYVTIKNNLVDHFCFVKDDGAGIYTYNGDGSTTWVQRKIIGNIILNGVGANEGTDRPGYIPTEGIYMDNNVMNVEISGNTIANCNRGLYIHNSQNLKIQSNTLFNNDLQQDFNHDRFGKPNRNNTILHNILFAKQADQNVSVKRSLLDDIPSFGRFDSNYYCRPFDDWMVISSAYTNSSGTRISNKYDLYGWQQTFSEDPHSNVSPVKLKSYKINSLIGSNKFPNGSFTSNIAGLYGSGCTLSWNNSNILDGGTVQVVAASTASKSTISLSVGSVSSTKKYILRFTAKGKVPVNFGAYLRLGPSPYTALTSTYYRRVTTTRTEFEILFENPKSASQANIMLQSTTPGATYWLDNIQLFEADITPLDPSSYIRFEYNPTKSNKVVALDGTYIDAKRKTYSSSITLPPYASAVLMKTSGTVAPSPSAAPSVTITSPTVNAIYNAPASVRLTAAVSVSGATISKVEFYRGTTLITTENIAPYDWTWNNVPAGSYSITAKAYASNGTVTTSTAVPITVRSTTTSQPVVTLTSPVNGASYNSPASIRITANASISGATISRVDFYKGTTKIRQENKAPYDWTWTNVPAGTYSIKAIAYGSNGTSTTSSIVSVTVRSASAAMVEPFDDGQRSDTTYAMDLYPNPVINTLQVEINGAKDNERVNFQIVNSNGNVLQTKMQALSGRYLRLNVANLLSGVYYLTVNGSRGVLTKSFLKQ